MDSIIYSLDAYSYDPEKAKELLQYSEKTVGEIAQETGYSDYYYFTKTFKRLTKMTPSEYRKKYEL